MNFGESGSQRVDMSPIFQGDLTLKLSAKVKPSAIKRKGKNVKVFAMKKPRVCTFFFYFVYFVMFSLINGVCGFPFSFLSFDLWQVKEAVPQTQTQTKVKATLMAQDASIQEVVYGEEIEFDAERGGFESGVYQQSLRARRFHKSHFQRSRKWNHSGRLQSTNLIAFSPFESSVF